MGSASYVLATAHHHTQWYELAWPWLSQNGLIVILGFELLLLCPLFAILLYNLFTYPRLQAGKTGALPRKRNKQKPSPMLSILLPARDEEQCIAACVRSLIAQDYAPLEVLVLNDNSQDATASIVQQIIDELPATQKGRLRLLHGQKRERGWVGKSFACHQLAAEAKGELLYFTDADTEHSPGTARAVVDCMRQYQVALLTAHPEYTFGSLGERLLVPLLNFGMLIMLPMALVYRRPEPMFSNGNGQLMCFHRTLYDAIGGHASVKASFIEDVELARRCKAAGERMIFIDASALVRCRMYRSFAETFAGFSKSQFATYGFKFTPILSATLLLLAVFVAPPLLAILFFARGAVFLGSLAAAVYLLVVVMRIFVTLRCVRKERLYMVLLCFLHPVAIFIECGAMLNSIRMYYSKNGLSWKGVRYSREELALNPQPQE